MKPLHWQGTSYTDYRDFPEETQDDLGYQLYLLQSGRDPRDWKAMRGLGKGVTGVYEIRNSSKSNIYRVAYVTKLGDSIVILHSWQKKTESTAKTDIEVIAERYRAALKELK